MNAIGCAGTRMQRPIRQPHTPRFIVRWASGRHKWRPYVAAVFQRHDWKSRRPDRLTCGCARRGATCDARTPDTA